MRVLDLFSGIGGFSLGLQWAGMRTIAFCEADPYCRAVLRKHWPGVPIHDDVRSLSADDLAEPADLVCGGYPCQPFSLAGKREGEADDRHLWPEMYRLVASVRPRWVIGENVAGHISMGLDDVLSDLGSLGYTCQPFVVPACAVDARHRRDRVWIVAHADNREGTLQPQGRECDFGRRAGDSGAPLGNSDSAGCADTSHASAERACGKAAPRALQRGAEEADVRGRGREMWQPEPDVGRTLDGLSARLDGGGLNGSTEAARSDEMLRALWKADAAPPLWFPARGSRAFQEAEVLQPPLRKPADAPEALGNLSLASEATPQGFLRGVWFDRSVACPSCRRTAEEQRSREHPDALRLVSQLLACDCGSARLGPAWQAPDAWAGEWEYGLPRIAKGVPNRVDRLRALGNAVVPQVVEVIGRAIMDVEARA